MRIFATYYSPAALIENDILTPIQAGRSVSGYDLPIIGDNSGDNISKLNHSFCEMTAIYWVWRNAELTGHVGFFQYRRYLDFNVGAARETDVLGLCYEERIGSDLLREYGISKSALEPLCESYEMILPEPFEVKSVGARSVFEQYCFSAGHHAEDIEQTAEIIGRTSPRYLETFSEVMRSPALYANNCFVMRVDIFRSYCGWVFPILFELDSKITSWRRAGVEKRAVGFISERLLTVFIAKYRADHPDSRILHVRRLFIRDTGSAEAAEKNSSKLFKARQVFTKTWRKTPPSIKKVLLPIVKRVQRLIT